MWKAILAVIVILGALPVTAFSETPYYRFWGRSNLPSHVLDQAAVVPVNEMPALAQLQGSVTIIPLLQSLKSDITKAETALRAMPPANATAVQIEDLNPHFPDDFLILVEPTRV